MSIKKIFLLRHGQTDYNLKGIVQGSGVDSSINSFGQLQSTAFFDRYREEGFEKIYTSALKRSQETIEKFIGLGIPHVVLAELNEISWGKHEGKPITPEEDQYYHRMLSQWREGKTDLKIEGGESPDEVAVRLKKGLDIILGQDEEFILICMHGRAMRILLCLLLNYGLKCMDLFEHENLCLYVLVRSGKMWSVERYCDVSHLEKIAAVSTVVK